MLPGWPPSSQNFKVFSGISSWHVWVRRAGRKPSSHCPRVQSQTWGHLALLKVIGQQLKRLANRAWTVPASSLLQPRDCVTVGPAGSEDHCCPSPFVCGGENWTLYLQKPDKTKAPGGENPCCPQRASGGGGAQCGLLSPWVAAKLGLATVHYLLWAVTMLRSAGEAQGQVR